MGQINLNQKELAAIREAIRNKNKCVLINDLMINIYTGGVVKVTNAHTGDEMTVLNLCEI